MSLYHYHREVISRGKKQSVVEKAAYISGIRLYDSHTGRTFDRSKRQDVLYSELFLPDTAPQQLCERQTFYNMLNQAEHRCDAQMARFDDFALPNELTLEQQIELLKSFVNNNFVCKGYCVDAAIHAGDKSTDRQNADLQAVFAYESNPHAHILAPFRMVDRDGFQRTKLQSRFYNNPCELKKLRQDWANHVNRAYRDAGYTFEVSPLSHKERGIKREPTLHIGPRCSAMEREGIHTKRGDRYRAALERNHQKTRERSRGYERTRS